MNAATQRFAGSNQGILALIQQAISGTPTTAQQLWDQIGASRGDYLIDPAAASQLLGTPAHQAAVAEVDRWAQDLAGRSIDGGAAAIDELLQRAGISTNLSGLRNPPPTIYPIAPDAQYKRQFKPSPTGGKGTVIEFINLANTPMMDWDMPGPSHRDANVTVRHLGDVEELVRDYTRQHPSSILQLYATPGGFRAWELGETHTAEQFQPRFEQLKVDPDYARLSTNAMPVSVNDIPLDPAGFRSRVSHKPGRTDWVAQPITQFRGRDAIVNPRNLQLVQTLHDRPIADRYLQGGVSPDAMAALQQQAGSASQALQAELRRRFRI